MIKKISLFLFTTLLVFSVSLVAYAETDEDYPRCIYSFKTGDASVPNYLNSQGGTEFPLFVDGYGKVKYYDPVSKKITDKISISMGDYKGTLEIKVSASSIYDNSGNKFICSKELYIESPAMPTALYSPDIAPNTLDYDNVSFTKTKNPLVSDQDNETAIQTCDSETVKKIWSSIENSTQYLDTKNYYVAQKDKITSFDYAGNYNTKIASGMSSADALNAVRTEVMKLATDPFPTESSYNSYITTALPNAGYYKDYDCRYDAEADNPAAFKSYYNYVPLSHTRLVNAATAFYKKALFAMNSSGSLSLEDYNNAVIGVESDKTSSNDTYIKEAAVRTTKYVEKMKNYSIGNVDLTCEALLTPEAVEFLNKIFNYFKIFAPILVIVLGTVDFSQAVLSSDKDNLSKATNKFIRRCIAAIALFFIPLLLTILLTAFGSSNPLCGVSTIILNL